MLEPIDQVAAKLTMLEFVLEATVADRLSLLPLDNSKKWKEDFVRLSRIATLPDNLTPASNEMLVEIFQCSCRMAEHFVEKVARRETLIRKARGDV
jgi:hypothetical protein